LAFVFVFCTAVLVLPSGAAVTLGIDALRQQYRRWIGLAAIASGVGLLVSFSRVLEPIRPLHAWVAVHNVASIRVLEKCGFRTVARKNEQHADGVAEVLMTLGPK
jgi:hypothetical protein